MSEYLNNNGRRERIVSVHDNIDVAADPVGFVPIEHYINMSGPTTTWLIKNLLPVEGSMLIHAQEKMGKSALAMQLALSLSGGGDWMGFEVTTTGRVLYLQVDTPRATWKERWRTLYELGYPLDSDRIRVADGRSIDLPSLNVGLPDHVTYLRSLVDEVRDDPLPSNATWGRTPVAVIIDTLRDCHSADENSATDMKNVFTALKAAVKPSALIIISHSKKKQRDQQSDILEANRGSSAVTAMVDAIIELAVPHRRMSGNLNYIGRDIEEGTVKIEKSTLFRPDDVDHQHGLLTWSVVNNDVALNDNILLTLRNPDLAGLRGHGRELAKLYRNDGFEKGDAAATAELRRFISRNPSLVPDSKRYLIPEGE